MKQIEWFEFMCTIEYLAAHQKEFSSNNLFIYSIRGNDCKHLIVRFFKVTDK